MLLLNFFAQTLRADIFDNSYFLDRRGQFIYPKNEMALKENEYLHILEKNKTILQKLGAIKYEIINGNLEKAKLLLLQSRYADDFSKNIQFRYLGIIHFIEGNFKQSQEFLTQKGMYNLTSDDTVCILRTLNFLIMNEVAKGQLEWKRCLDVTINQSETQHVWMNTILKLKINDEPQITSVPFKKVNIENEKGDFLRLFLKMALYLNQQDKIFDRLPFLGDVAFADPEIRELIGMLYYREGKLAKAYQFVEDLASPNSENIKGNLYLAQKKYELAYGQFKLALNKKANSQNALERIIPIAWILKQWDDGLGYLANLQADPKDQYAKMAIEAAFLTQAQKYHEASKKLETIVVGSNDAQSTEVNQLYTFNAMMLKNKDLAETYADKACKLKDGLNCWLQFQLTLWDNFALTAHRDDDVFQKEMDITEELIAEFEENPIQEKLFISQKDIEEMDNDIIRLYPYKNE
jgi:hypothetical protein